MLQTKEQCLHACQIQSINKTACTSEGLSAVRIAQLDGTITQHADKATIEVACLDEAQAHFTQVNNTPFLTLLLVNELELLNCNNPPFDEIAAG